MRLIDADALREAIPETDICIGENCRDCGLMEREQILALINDAPTIDRPTRSQFKRMAAQLGYEAIVHCKDCKHCRKLPKGFKYYGSCSHFNTHSVDGDDYCSYGERRADEQ